MDISGKIVFFVGAHPDDIEIGCGALISHIVDKAEVFCITLSDNQKNPALKNLVDEYHASMAILGIDEEHSYLESFETRRFKHARQEILEYLLNLNKKFKPDLVFVHTDRDLHQDHNTVTEEALRAFRGTSLFGYDVIRSSHGFFPTFLVEVNEADVDRKINALSAYKTYQDKYYFAPNLTRSIMVRNGAIAEREYAEGFNIFRMIGAF